MSDQTDSDDRKLKASGGKTLSLKRTVESGHVRQQFSHGRTKSVVVEKKRKRTLKPGTDDVAAPLVEPEPIVEKAAPAPKRAAAKKAEPAAEKSRAGVVLRTLTEEEKVARAQALAF